MSVDAATFTCDLRRLHVDCSVAMNKCHQEGQLSRAVHLWQAREALMKAINTPGRDERQLTLETIPDESSPG